MPAEDVLRTFDVAETVRGREWVLNTTHLAGGGRQWSFEPFLRVYAFGKRMQAIQDAVGVDALIQRLLKDDSAAESELTAIYLLRRPDTEVEIAPEVDIAARRRRPDFRIRKSTEPWTYVEVTQLNRSMASTRTRQLLDRITGQVMPISQAFALEVVLWREPTDAEEDELISRIREACNEVGGSSVDVADLASIMVKAGDPSVVIPSMLPKDNGTRMSLVQSISGPDQPNRQIVVRVPFGDHRAEDILAAEAKQLPKGASGLVMVDVVRQPTAFESWTDLVPHRFTSTLHTRVGGVLLFMTPITLSTQGMVWVPYLKLIANPHARIPLPSWIPELVENIRAESRLLTGDPE